MFFAGIDLGTTYTKTHTGIIFPSGVSENIYTSSNVLTFENEKYSVELNNQKAEFDININKGLNKNTRINFLYALYRLADYDKTIFQNVVVGLPCSQWKNEETVTNFKSYLLSKDTIILSVNDLEKRLTIENIDVVPEGSTAYYASEMQSERFEGRKVLILDIGGLTINSILMEDDGYVDCYTDESGILKIYKDMSEKITSETGYDIKYSDMFGILQYGLYIKGQKCDVDSIIRPIALEHCYNIYKNLKLKWSIDTIPFIPCIGAGSITMIKYLKDYIPHAELQEKPQLLAVIGMGEMAGVRL
jgi:hypothetical protein